MFLSKDRLGVFIPLTVAETFGIVAFRLIPGSVATAFLCACMTNSIIMIIWIFFIWPFFVNPLRHLPTVWRPFLHIRIGFRHRRGEPLLQLLRTVSNSGIIHIRTGLGPSTLLVTSPHALRDVLSTKNCDFAKPAFLAMSASRVAAYSLFFTEGATHKIQRKAMAPGFAIRNIRTLYPAIWGKTQEFLHHIEQEIQTHPLGDSKPGQLVGYMEMKHWASRLALDIVSIMVFSRDMCSLKIRDHPMAQALEIFSARSIESLLLLCLSAFLPQWLIRIIPCKTNILVAPQSLDYIKRNSSDILRDKRAEHKCEKDEDDVVDTMIRSGKMSDTEMRHQIISLLAASSDTTTGTITWCCYHLSLEPHIQTLLRNEIRSWIPSASAPVSWSDLENMPYLNGVCEEVLRLYPVVSVAGREAVCQTSIAGQVIPVGTSIMIPPYAINRSPEIWGEKADQFLPERWIDKDEKTGKDVPNRHGGARSTYGQLTFLQGPRGCIAKDLVKAELRCAFAGIFGRFRVEFKEPGQKVTVGGTLTEQPVDMHLKLSRLPGWE